MNHTFLFTEARWRATGFFTDDAGKTIPVEGITTVTHKDGVWLNEGAMKLLEGTRGEYSNLYEIVPFQPGAVRTTWKSVNPNLGNLEGIFLIVNDVIFSFYASDDGTHYGSECILRIDDGTYNNWGCLASDGRVVSTWTAQLKKIN